MGKYDNKCMLGFVFCGRKNDIRLIILLFRIEVGYNAPEIFRLDEVWVSYLIF